MRIYPNVTQEDLISLNKLSEQQKNQRFNKNKFFRQTHDIKSAESYEPITKKSEQVNESTQNL